MKAVTTLFLFFVWQLAMAGNGPYGMPTEVSYRALSAKEKALYEARVADLSHPEFVGKSHYKSPSFYVTPKGMGELRELVNDLETKLPDYSRLVSIGRSGSGILAFMRGYYAGNTTLSDLPFSYGDMWTPITEDERNGLRRHLTNNGLSPETIVASTKPILFFDFVYSGQGSGKLLEEIALWAKELGLAEQVKAKIHFYGCFPAEMIAHQHMMGLYYATLKELPGLGSTPPTEAEIQKEALNYDLPGKYGYEKAATKVHERRISVGFYNYAGTHGPNAHQSLVRASWAQDQTSAVDNAFTGKSTDNGYVELFYLRREGELVRHSCPKRLAK